MPENISGTNQKPERRRPFGTGLVRHCPQGLFSPFFTFLRAIYFSAHLDFPRPHYLPVGLRGCICFSEQIIYRKQSSGAPLGIQDSLGFWIPCCGFRIPGTGLQLLSVEREFWIPIVSGIPDSLSCIPDSKTRDSGFHEQNVPVFGIPRQKSLGFRIPNS